jgi:DNA-binding response OmpR family regulator
MPDEFLARIHALARRSITNASDITTLQTFSYKDIIYLPLTQEITQ